MNPLFGTLFDLDGNGRVTFEEELFGITAMQKMSQEQKSLADTDELGDDSDDGV